MSQKTREQLELELEFLKKRRLVDGAAAVLNNTVRWAGLVGVAYFGIARPFESLAGRATTADIAVYVWAKLMAGDAPTWSAVLPWGITVLALIYGVIQRKLRRDTIERLHGRIEALERERDPSRTSSTLTPRGDTRQEDRV